MTRRQRPCTAAPPGAAAVSCSTSLSRDSYTLSALIWPPSLFLTLDFFRSVVFFCFSLSLCLFVLSLPLALSLSLACYLHLALYITRCLYHSSYSCLSASLSISLSLSLSHFSWLPGYRSGAASLSLSLSLPRSSESKRSSPDSIVLHRSSLLSSSLLSPTLRCDIPSVLRSTSCTG